MELIDASTAEAYLRRTGRAPSDARIEVERLAGGVSNEVLLVSLTSAGGPPQQFVMKQSRPQLRVPQPWFCTVERVWRETAVLAICARLADADQVPRLLFEDRENYLFGMTAAPRDHRTWKQDLLAGIADPQIAAACGRLLGQLHAGSWRDAEIAQALADRQLFDELRLDPYYRAVGRAVPAAAAELNRLVESIAANCCSLVHADFSPKNILLHHAGLMLVDFETGHYGDPAFDLGFFFSHLLLKGYFHAPRHSGLIEVARSAWHAYHDVVAAEIPAEDWAALARRWTQHLGACIWSRLDGKSQVEYLTDSARRDAARDLARELLCERSIRWEEAFVRWQNSLHTIGNE